MVCPKCSGGSTICKDSRYKDGTVYRRRMCQDCGWRFTTIEVSLETFNSMNTVLKKLLRVKTAVLNIIDE